MYDARQAQCVSSSGAISAWEQGSPATSAGRTLVFWEDGNLTKVINTLPGLTDEAGTIVVYGKVLQGLILWAVGYKYKTGMGM
jgi:hypothetical protein